MPKNDKLSADEQKHIVDASHITAKIIQREKGTGRYVIRRELARGAMGVIYVVYDQDLQRISAMKVITTQYIEMEKRYNAFITEARLTAQLEHPNIVPIHHLGVITDNGSPFYTMKLVEGEPLSEIIYKISSGRADYKEKYTRNKLLNVFRSVCNAVAYAHSRGIIHRDIKPENIMVGQFGEVQLMDWGLAKPIVYADPQDPDKPSSKIMNHDVSRTQDGMIKGSPAYISPEQAFGEAEDLDYRTDIFLLGSTLYHMFTHYPPYQGDNIMEIISRAERCDYVAPSKRNEDCKLPLALERIILRAMAPVKENRYESVEVLIEDIDAYIAGRQVCGRKVFSPGEHLIEIGEEARESYVIIHGTVEVYRQIDGEKIIIANLGSGEIIGEMAGITEEVRSANVVALETTDTLVITYELMREELQKLPPWMEHIVFTMAERIRTLNERIHPLRNKGAFPVLNLLYHTFLSNREKSESNTTPSFTRESIIEEITLNLGLDNFVCDKILTLLKSTSLLTINKNRELSINNLDDFAHFVDYVRYKYGITRGVKEIKEIRLSHEKETYFRKIAKKLSDLFVDRTGTKTSVFLS